MPNLRSLIWDFSESCSVQRTVGLCVLKWALLTPGCKWKEELFPAIDFRGLGGREGREWAHSIARMWVPISSPLTHMDYILRFLRYLVGSKSVSFRLSDPDAMSNTALETITSSGCKKLLNQQIPAITL